MMRRSPKGDILVKLDFSFFSEKKILKSEKKKTFETMITPPKDMDRILSLVSEARSDEFLWYCRPTISTPLSGSSFRANLEGTPNGFANTCPETGLD